MQELSLGESGLKAWPVLAIAVIQALLSVAHWFIYRTWIDFWGVFPPAGMLALQVTLFLLAFSFIAAALLGFFFASRPVTLLYKVAAVWLGLLNFFFFAACLCWVAVFAFAILGFHANKPLIAAALYGMAILASIYGLINARAIRIRRVPIQLPGLPQSWRGRTALLISDLHLGNINSLGFSRRIASLASGLKPDIVFLPGDIFDGAKADAVALAEPFRDLAPPFGIYFSTGNHDEFGNAAHYSEILTRTGIRVLDNEKVTVDGLQIVGVPYGDSTSPIRLRSTLERLAIAPGQASILLNHAPHRLPIVEQAGIGLQVSGHTHGGQMFPFTWFTRRAFGKFTYGLQQFGKLQVYTSSGAGTWGPPMRVGTHPEIVLLQFE
jgi:predicted MPP superfamily phosphohydrolase